ncbi:MAG: COQ9 family protein [Alphaproteobacteria bacterium]
MSEASMNADALREQVLLAALTHVPFEGWTNASLRAGASDAGLDPSQAALAFPGGPVEAIDFFNRYADARMLEALEDMDLDAMRVRDRIIAGVRVRLEQNRPHREAVRRALAVLALPLNAPLGMRCVARTVDAIWRAGGDTSSDYNWYTKRGLLAGVYTATVLYWINDKSEGPADTYHFLERRIDTVMAIGGQLGRAGKSFANMGSPFDIFRRPFPPR